jgi:uncharacterized protein YdeI (YjbR/CyaY-like superfamily)
MKTPEERLVFASAQEWRAWLEEHHAEASEAWLTHCKKKAVQRCVGYEEAVEEALCFGWIDGLLRSVDEETFALRYTPRRKKSVWSETNKRRAERLIEDRRMTAAGLEKISEAKVNGEWEAATRREDVETIPPDLEEALRKHTTAWSSFSKWTASRKKQYLFGVESAKRPETRQRRIQAIVEMAGEAPDSPASSPTTKDVRRKGKPQ